MNRRLLIVGAHPDDEAIATGGTAARLAREGWDVFALFVTEGCSTQYPTRPEILPRKQAEARRAAAALGLRDVFFRGPRFGWIVGEHGTIFRTRDGGEAWTLQVTGVPIVRTIPRGEAPRPREVAPELETPPDRLELTAVRFADPDQGWAVGSYSDVAESVVLHTTDGGASWQVEHVQPGEMLRTLFVLDADHVWAAGDRARNSPQVILCRTSRVH